MKLKSLGMTASPRMGGSMNIPRVCLSTPYPSWCSTGGTCFMTPCQSLLPAPPLRRMLLFPQWYYVPCSSLDCCMAFPTLFQYEKQKQLPSLLPQLPTPMITVFRTEIGLNLCVLCIATLHTCHIFGAQEKGHWTEILAGYWWSD